TLGWAHAPLVVRPCAISNLPAILILREPQHERDPTFPPAGRQPTLFSHVFAVAPMLNQQRSRAIFAEAKKYLPGGVDSPVRSFRGVGGDPVVVASASGARMTDVDGDVFID